MDKKVLKLTNAELKYNPKKIEKVIELLEEGNTIPFIARYRKELTGSLDEVQLREIQVTYQRNEKIEIRKSEVLKKISEQNKLTEDIRNKINNASTLQEVEDIYLPYKKKRKTKAQKAVANGLEPLAKWLLRVNSDAPMVEAKKYLNKEVPDEEVALNGAVDILAEAFGEEAQLRDWVRKQMSRKGVLIAKEKDSEKDENGTYEDYYDFEQVVSKLTSYRILAINRGEKEGILRVKINTDDDYALRYLHSRIIGSKKSTSNDYVERAYTEAYKKFIKPAIERELRATLTEKAENEAIKVFGENLYNLLMQAPLKNKIILGMDPAFRTGCKLAIIDETGKFLVKDVIYPHEKHKGEKPNPELRKEAAEKLETLINRYNVDMIAIGNGTASRESEKFVAEVLKKIDKEVYYVIVNESGASVYSASEVARDEFPDFNVEERSAVSIARRLQDPLAELIKINPESIGVGQYQHDLPQKQLDSEVEATVETAVNKVGVNLNTASIQLLTYISGLNKTTAQNIILYREENGKFQNRKELKKVPRLGPKAYEQAAGFLRIIDGNESLDNTDIHPESYTLAEKLIKDLGITKEDMGTNTINDKLAKFNVERYAIDNELEVITVKDIVKSLMKPGRDGRESMPMPLLKSDILKIEDLKAGMQLEGTVRNVVDFGAFVDIGVKQDGLVHLSKLSKKYVSNPRDIVAVGQIVTVWVEDVDLNRRRIQLTMVNPNE